MGNLIIVGHVQEMVNEITPYPEKKGTVAVKVPIIHISCCGKFHTFSSVNKLP